MESRFAALKILDCSGNNQSKSNESKITRAFSFNDLPTKTTIIKEWTSLQKEEPNLSRQYSYQLDNLSSGLTSSCSIVKELKKDLQEFDNFIGQESSISDSNHKFTSVNKQKIIISSTPSNMQNEVEYMDVEENPESNDETTNTTITSAADLSEKILLDFVKKTCDMKELQKEIMEPIDLTNRKTNIIRGVFKGLNNDVFNVMKRKLVEKKADNISRERDAQLKSKSKTKSRWFRNFLVFITIFSLLMGFMSIIMHQRENRHSLDFVDAVAELKERIHGQDQAMEILSEYLLLDEPSLKVITLAGGTGVGKSYTVEIIKENFPRQYYITHFWYPPIQEDALFTLYPQLIILENLREHDLNDVVEFLKTLQRTVNDRHITVLIVFNFERMDGNGTRILDLNKSAKTLQNAFLDGEMYAEIILYSHLNENALEKCITDAIRESELTLSAEEIDLVKQYLFTHDAGCKGAYAKVQLIGNKIQQDNIILNTIPSKAE